MELWDVVYVGDSGVDVSGVHVYSGTSLIRSSLIPDISDPISEVTILVGLSRCIFLYMEPL